jgi:hypothetical protein
MGAAGADESFDLPERFLHREIVDEATHYLDATAHASSRARIATMRSAALPATMAIVFIAVVSVV